MYGCDTLSLWMYNFTQKYKKQKMQFIQSVKNLLMNSGDDYTISVICVLFLDLKFILCNTVMKDKNLK